MVRRVEPRNRETDAEIEGFGDTERVVLEVLTSCGMISVAGFLDSASAGLASGAALALECSNPRHPETESLLVFAVRPRDPEQSGIRMYGKRYQTC